MDLCLHGVDNVVQISCGEWLSQACKRTPRISSTLDDALSPDSRTSNVERRTSNVERRTSNVEQVGSLCDSCLRCPHRPRGTLRVASHLLGRLNRACAVVLS
ncbi:hypothetical protein C8T65DRAFT_639007 [Cerioporus squamosus]|nr:hypothetical protein C8T65DRAFT_639007 [Cerioporus squamosus]